MRNSSIAFVILALCSILVAQQALNNDSVIKLAKAGLSEDFIVSTISAKPGAYDTSTDGINALKAAGASDKVIAAVLAKASLSRTGGDSNAGVENNLKCYTLEYVRSDKKWWHGPGFASDRYDEISEDIRNGLIVALDKRKLSLAAHPEARCRKFSVNLVEVKNKLVKTGGALSPKVYIVEIFANFKFEDGTGHLIYEKDYSSEADNLNSGLKQMKDRAVVSLVNVIASDEGLLKSLATGVAQ